MSSKSHRQRVSVALVISVVFHLVVAVALWVNAKNRPPPPERHQAIELTIVEFPSTEPEVTPEPPQPVQQPQPQQQQQVRPDRVQPERTAQQTTQPQQGGGQTGSEGKSEGTQGTGAPLATDAEKHAGGIILVPGAKFQLGLKGHGEDEPSRGQTIKNGPGEEPDAVAMAEYKAEKANRKMQGMVEDMAGAAASSTVIDPYFTRAIGAVRGQFANIDVPTPKKTAGQRIGQGLETWRSSAEAFGSTGSPMTENETAIEASKSGFARAAQGAGNGAGGVNDMETAGSLRAGQQMMAAQTLAVQQITKAQLVTVIELWQVADGAVADASIIKSSGFRDFDEFALHRIRKAFAALEDPPDEGFGIARGGDGWRTVWRLSYTPPSVRVELLRVVKGARKNQFDRAQE